MNNWRDLIDRLAINVIAFGVVGVTLFLAVYMVIHSPESELTTRLVDTVLTVGFAGVIAFFLTRDKQA